PRSASGSSFAQNAQNPTKRVGVDVVVDAHAVPGAELDLDDAVLRASSVRRRARRPRRLRQGRCRVDLDRQKDRAVSPDRVSRARQPSPCEEQALRHAVPTGDLAHHCARRQRLLDNPRLLVPAPAASPLDPENLPIHLCMTLKLALRSHPSRPSSRKQGGRRRRVTTFLTLLMDEQGGAGLSPRMILLVADARTQWAEIDRRIAAFDTELVRWAKENDEARRLITIPGFGAIVASALVAAVGHAESFDSGR